MTEITMPMYEDISRVKRVVKKNKLSQVEKARRNARNAGYMRVSRAKDLVKGIKDLTVSVPLDKHGEIREMAHQMCDDHLNQT